MKTDYDQTQQNLADLQEQLKIGQRVQAEQMKELRTLRDQVARQREQLAALEQDRDHMKSALSEGEEQMNKFQSERTSLRRELADAQGGIQQFRLQSQGREEELSTESRGAKLELERLQRDLQVAQTAYEQALRERETQKSGYEERILKLNADLRDREQALRQLRDQLVKPGTPQAPIVQEPEPQISAQTPDLKPVKAPEIPAQVSAVKVYRVEEQLGFLVLSLEGESGWAKASSALVLSAGDKPVAEVELGDVDSAGLAMAYITRRANPNLPIRKGDFLSARPLLVKTSKVPTPPEESVVATTQEAGR